MFVFSRVPLTLSRIFPDDASGVAPFSDGKDAEPEASRDAEDKAERPSVRMDRARADDDPDGSSA